MPSYWWECESCGATGLDFVDTCGVSSITRFIRDVMLPSDWDQSHLLRVCKACDKQSLRIAYKFPRKIEPPILRLVHLVGVKVDDDYLPMMWEAYPTYSPDYRWFDFKYINGYAIFGLNKPAVFSRENLRQLFALYRAKTATRSFP